ncbi:hypothetical protein V2J09_014611 [Rumex salicifolius]
MSKSTIERYVDQRRSFGSLVDSKSEKLSEAFHRTGSVFAGSGLGQIRYMSTSIGQDNMMNYAADVSTNVPAVSELPIHPVAALQHFIDGIHSFTGLNWWACIALTTLIYRGATVPLDIYGLKAISKLKLMKLRVEEIERQMKETVFFYCWVPSNVFSICYAQSQSSRSEGGTGHHRKAILYHTELQFRHLIYRRRRHPLSDRKLDQKKT